MNAVGAGQAIVARPERVPLRLPSQLEQALLGRRVRLDPVFAENVDDPGAALDEPPYNQQAAMPVGGLEDEADAVGNGKAGFVMPTGVVERQDDAPLAIEVEVECDLRQSASATGRGSMLTPAHHEASSP